jgi:hypothetical protein
MSCVPEKKKFTYSFGDYREFLRVDSLYYSRGFSDEEKVHKNLIYTLDDKVWFDRAIHPAIREVMACIGRHCPFEDACGVEDITKTVKGTKEVPLEHSEHKVMFFNVRADLVKKEYYAVLRGAISDFLRAYFISEWLRTKNTAAYAVALADYEKKKEALLSAALNFKKCHQGRRRLGWW